MTVLQLAQYMKAPPYAMEFLFNVFKQLFTVNEGKKNQTMESIESLIGWQKLLDETFISPNFWTGRKQD